ncbi:hypothetical protein BGW38_001343 [Lunasporangiospora selenospora]|uniref:F-box domain-containing protein n=1 Tax=Lunasporangiospora selenospora TaxID=979761 RepID=A0A9P6G1R2_9FUNG|nr:hypothetical protein BGW38_001343 [Lunasporangiospora selenospora]
MDLPIIRHYLGPFLSRADLINCVRVCQQWHASFLPFLWRRCDITADWTPEGPAASPSLDVLIRNARFIRELQLQTTNGISDFLERCVSLRVLIVHGKQPASAGDALWTELSALVRRNPSLEWIVFGLYLENSPSAKFLEALVQSCPRLRCYESSQCRYDDPAQMDALMKIITSVEQIVSKFEHFVNVPFNTPDVLPNIRQLILKDARGFCTMTQLDLVCRCPNLEDLKWCVGRDAIFPIQEFCERIAKACPKLRSFHTDSFGLQGPNDLMKILDALPPLETLLLYGMVINRNIYTALRRHFATLQTLDIIDCFYVKSWMAQDILESCPNLVKLAISKLLLRDIVQGKDWVTHKLEDFSVHIIADSDSVADQWITFGQISKLTQLRRLRISTSSWSNRVGNFRFRLESGVDQLKTLIKLRELGLGGHAQEMSPEDDLSRRLRSFKIDLKVDEEGEEPTCYSYMEDDDDDDDDEEDEEEDYYDYDDDDLEEEGGYVGDIQDGEDVVLTESQPFQDFDQGDQVVVDASLSETIIQGQYNASIGVTEDSLDHSQERRKVEHQ